MSDFLSLRGRNALSEFRLTKLNQALQQSQLKLSGISAYCAPGTASLAEVRPWADHVLTSFGADRMVWGSDWPVVNLAVGLPDWIEMTHSLIAGLSSAEQLAITSGNARRIYLKDR